MAFPPAGRRSRWAPLLSTAALVAALLPRPAVADYQQVCGSGLVTLPANGSDPDTTEFWSLVSQEEYGDISSITQAQAQARVSLVPEIFVPAAGGGRTLTLKMVARNSGWATQERFGFYNVVDVRYDSGLGRYVVDPGNRHILFECSDGAGTVRTVDFCADARWKKGPVGFFLITPQGAGGCAPIEESTYVYFTELRLNAQEDPNNPYIHHLVYRSLTHTNAFYFGYEDLWLGGDCDYQDMLVRVDGLLTDSPPELCNNLDDNCDGQTDEDLAVDCSNACGPGLQRCVSGQWTACNAPQPAASETLCDGRDDDCDYLIDEGLVRSCANACGPGSEVCINGQYTSCTAPVASPEVCDGLDNDCDGAFDSDDPDLVYSPPGCVIQNAHGACPGLRGCIGGVEGCVGPPPGPEICDGRDNDCDGGTDNADYGRCATACGPEAGQLVCTAGQLACQGPQPGPERCNGQDDDCDGRYDEEPELAACLATCGSEAVPGLQQCVELAGPADAGRWSPCAPLAAGAEVCDGDDNDCDGLLDAADPDLPPLGACATGCGETAGTLECVNGVAVCRGPEPSPEVCDGLDNDCDGLVDAADRDLAGLGLCSSACETQQRICVAGAPECPAREPEPEVCDGFDSDCDGRVDNNLDLGVPEAQCATACGPGRRVCNPATGTFEGCSAPEPQPEACDGLDNDCDGPTDEDAVGATLVRACETACGSGYETCAGGAWSDCTAPLPSPETCDGRDNDCDGLVDAADPGLLLGACDSPCGPGTGQTTCSDGVLGCEAPPVRTEICNGRDDDCDGSTDEELVRACDTVCGPGSETCNAGDWQGCTAPVPAAEGCDDADNDCDGRVDEELVRPCRLSCTLGTEHCESGQWVGCDAPGPGPESCDGLDNDCDGLRDEGADGLPIARPCTTACGGGVEICLAGAFVNCNAPPVLPEVCDNADNDCDGTVDEDLTRACVNVCGQGEQVCTAGAWGDCSLQTSAEVCDGVDNDCDGIIDLLLEACVTACGTGERVCQNGTWLACSAGEPVAEVCDGQDNDCDGEIDEYAEVTCPDPATLCHQGRCLRPCSAGGECVGDDEQCIEGFCESGACTDVACADDEVCREGRCVDIVCLPVACPAGAVCSQGLCVDDDCYVGGCPAGLVCVAGSCVDDPCLAAPCPPESACALGVCFDSCAPVDCEPGFRCVEGRCISDPCAEANCADYETCVDGRCFPDACRALACPDGRVCVAGACEPDPCIPVHCPAGARCEAGQCVKEAPAGGDGDAPADEPASGSEFRLPEFAADVPTPGPEADGGGGLGDSGDTGLTVGVGSAGCACRQAAHDGAAPWAVLGALVGAGIAFAVARRSTRRRRAVAARTLLFVLVAAALAFGGCGTPPGAGDVAGPGSDVLDGWAEVTRGELPTFVEFGPDTPSACTPSNGGIEICDEIDNDCDGFTDENYALDSDPRHCGGCGRRCDYANAAGVCVASQCGLGRCYPGYADIDAQAANGCEALCERTNGGIEICDGLDNDCNGAVDDGFDVQTDPAHCGRCGAVCRLPNAIEVGCAAGRCFIGRCADGFADVDGSPLTGCEADCVPSNGGLETCDGLDNDCDGVADDGYLFALDPQHCGDCVTVCSYAHAAPYCVAGDCVMGPCEPGYADIDGLAETGCEAPCEISESGIETCDERDNDCDGTTDEGFDLTGDVRNCGRCGSLCEFPNAVAECRARACALFECLPGFVDADGNAENGCETACEVTNGGSEACDGLDNDCDGAVDEGFDVLVDPLHCGTCNYACQVPNARPGCVAGFCTVAACEPGFADFNGLVADGCEALCEPSQGGVEICDGLDNDCDGEADDPFDLTSDPAHCGACNRDCAAEIGPQAVAGCTAGRCTIGTCAPGFVDLDRRAETGCEYPCSVTNDGEELCDEADNDCDGITDNGFNKPSDPDNCGRCGRVCLAPHAQLVCRNGECALFQCAPGYHDVAGGMSDGCEYGCAVTSGGVESCDQQDNDCDGDTDEGFDLERDPNHCGECGRVCALPHADMRCDGGDCSFVSCHERYFDANGQLSDGCEYACTPSVEPDEVCDELDNDCNGLTDDGFDKQSDPDNCGACGIVCVLAHAAAHCEAGRCVRDTCEEPWRDANLSLADGCECLPSGAEVCDEADNDCDGLTDEGILQVDPEHCGRCDNDCTANDAADNTVSFCNGGRCVHLCAAGFADPDGDGRCTCSIGVEVCDGADNDCDGQVDDADNDLEPPPPRCLTSLGVCAAAEPTCAGAGGWQCGFPDTFEEVETRCDGLDNDCDGLVDEGLEPPAVCLTQGLCAGTLARCAEGSWVCPYPAAYQVEETRCDSLDNDCDGSIDEGFPVGQVCSAGVGVCARAGLRVCRADGAAVVCSAEPDWSEQGPELCDGRDNDCDNFTDEDIARPTEMVHVVAAGRDFWIDRHEASRPDARADFAGFNGSYACSREAVLPWTDVSYTQAAAACAARGKRLCNDAEWRVACSYVDAGTTRLYPYGNAFVQASCNQQSSGMQPTGHIATCQSALQVFDLAGNAAEWTTCANASDCAIVKPFLGGHYAESDPYFYQCRARNNAAEGFHQSRVGFRCCQ